MSRAIKRYFFMVIFSDRIVASHGWKRKIG
jgi:hypothetical protein